MATTPRITLGKNKWCLNIEPLLLFGLLKECSLLLLSSCQEMKEISVQPVRFGGQQHIVEPFVTIKEIAPTFLLGCLVMLVEFSKTSVVTYINSSNIHFIGK